MKLDTWKNPEAIVSCEWLSQNLNNKNIAKCKPRILTSAATMSDTRK